MSTQPGNNVSDWMVENHKLLDFILDEAAGFVYAIDTASHEILYANGSVMRTFGKGVVGQTCFHALQQGLEAPCADCPEMPAAQESDDESLAAWENTNSINRRTYLFNGRHLHWPDGRRVRLQVGIDITRQKALESAVNEERRASQEAFEILTNSTIEGLIIYDENKRCIRVNQVAPMILGYSAEEMIGMDAFAFIAPQSRDHVRQVIRNTDQAPYEAQMLRRDGSVFWAILRGRDLMLAGRQIRVSAILDISDIKEKEAQISRLAYYDALTGLPNRLYLNDRLSQALSASDRSGLFGALLFIDLDHFKTINDTRGHAVGDKVLIEAAQRIRRHTREADFVSRFGGDEFVILLEGLSTLKWEASQKSLQAAQKVLEALANSYRIDGFDYRLSGSIGIALFKGDEVSREDLLRYADTAMYNAKDSGRDMARFFDPVLQDQIEAKALMIARLREILEQDRLRLHYQPQILFDGGTATYGVELLARWPDEPGGMIPPNRFIPAAEESGLIVPLGQWVLQHAVRQLKAWESDPLRRDWRISINVSVRQFEEGDCIARISELLERLRFRPDRLCLELTESILLDHTEDRLHKLWQLREMGFLLSIDDFGTGYSSLAYLKRLPINELKIDRSFISEIESDSSNAILVQTMISIGQQFGYEVVAEGVENEAQYRRLLEMGCTRFQGYFFGRPQPLELEPGI